MDLYAFKITHLNLNYIHKAGTCPRWIIFSCYGRVHPEAVRIFELLSQRVARCIGVGDSRIILRRMHAAIGVVLARRSVAMVKACLRPLSPGALNLLLGDGVDDV